VKKKYLTQIPIPKKKISEEAPQSPKNSAKPKPIPSGIME